MFAHERSLVGKYQDRPFVLLGVNLDARIEKLRQTQEKEHLNWRSWWDGSGGPIAQQWKVEGLPMLFLLDRKGNIRWKSEGVPSTREMDEMIEKLVKEGESEGSKQAALSRR